MSTSRESCEKMKGLEGEKGRKQSWIYSIYLWFWNWKIHTFMAEEDYHHSKPHIMSRRLKTSFRLRLFSHKNNRKKDVFSCGRREVRRWDALFVWWRRMKMEKRKEKFSIVEEFSLSRATSYEVFLTIISHPSLRLMVKAFFFFLSQCRNDQTFHFLLSHKNLGLFARFSPFFSLSTSTKSIWCGWEKVSLKRQITLHCHCLKGFSFKFHSFLFAFWFAFNSLSLC